MSAESMIELVPAADVEPVIGGTVAHGFEAVRDAFTANFLRRDACREIGASVTVYRGDQCIVDLWGGFTDARKETAWDADTLLNVYSTTKGAVAFCVALLVDRGALRYEEFVASVWPEFAAAGKREVTVGHILSHQAGLPAFEEPTTLDDLLDWERCCRRLAAQAPRWRPGEKTGYHAVTYGYLAGEIVRRVTGKSIGAFLAAEIAQPLQADFIIGLPAGLDGRVAETIPPQNLIDPTLIPLPEETRLSITNPALQPGWANLPAWRRAELPALNGHASARGIARIYAALANDGVFNGHKLLSHESLLRMTQPQPKRVDLMLGMELAWAHGVALNGTTGFFGPDARTFGHSGWGGSFGCADPDARLAVGYVCNQMGPDLTGDVRARELCTTIYRCL